MLKVLAMKLWSTQTIVCLNAAPFYNGSVKFWTLADAWFQNFEQEGSNSYNKMSVTFFTL